MLFRSKTKEKEGTHLLVVDFFAQLQCPKVFKQKKVQHWDFFFYDSVAFVYESSNTCGIHTLPGGFNQSLYFIIHIAKKNSI